jgi:hypothetical protein
MPRRVFRREDDCIDRDPSVDADGLELGRSHTIYGRIAHG